MDDNEPRCRLTKCIDAVETATGVFVLGFVVWAYMDMFIRGGWGALVFVLIALFLLWFVLDLTIGFVRFVDEILRGPR